MPVKDVFHNLVKHALGKEGWVVTHEHYYLKIDDRDMFIDLAAEKVLAAEKDGVRIAVEVKSFLSPSPLSDFHLAVGQFVNYRLALHEHDPQRQLFLAIPLDTYDTFFGLPFVQKVIMAQQIALTRIGGLRAGQGEFRDIIEQRIGILIIPCNLVGQSGIVAVSTRVRNGHRMGGIDHVFRGQIIL